MIIVLWVIWTLIWYFSYSRDILNIKKEILLGMYKWIPSMGATKNFIDFKLGSVFNLFLIAVVVIVKHFFYTVGFVLQTLFLIYAFTKVILYLRRRIGFAHFLLDSPTAAKKEYKGAMRPYFFANILYVLYTFYLYGLSYYILSIW